MAVLAGLPALQSLRIDMAGNDLARAILLAPAGLASLARMTRLKTLDFTAFSLDDAWLGAISQLAGLRQLRVSGRGITDAGLEPLGRLTHLEILSVDGDPMRPFTEVGLAHLAPLKKLTGLRLDARIGEEQVAAFLASHPTLSEINGNQPEDMPPGTSAGQPH